MSRRSTIFKLAKIPTRIEFDDAENDSSSSIGLNEMTGTSVLQATASRPGDTAQATPGGQILANPASTVVVSPHCSAPAARQAGIDAAAVTANATQNAFVAVSALLRITDDEEVAMPSMKLLICLSRSHGVLLRDHASNALQTVSSRISSGQWKDEVLRVGEECVLSLAQISDPKLVFAMFDEELTKNGGRHLNSQFVEMLKHVVDHCNRLVLVSHLDMLMRHLLKMFAMDRSGAMHIYGAHLIVHMHQGIGEDGLKPFIAQMSIEDQELLKSYVEGEKATSS